MFGSILVIDSKLRAAFRQTIRLAFLALSPWGSPAQSFIVGNLGGALLLVYLLFLGHIKGMPFL